jgi:glycosyltransferase involved in cell wall biosynthesis
MPERQTPEGLPADTVYRFDRAGRWSGGGKAFLNNVDHAEGRHTILRGGASAIPIFARNLPPRAQIPNTPFLLAPQNAWPWAPTFSGIQELGRLAVLRLASELFMRRAAGVMRISSAIPPINSNSSPVIHNVLDTGFEHDLITSRSAEVDSEAVGAVVSVGSLNSYRNILNTIGGYRRYRQAGGRLRLWIAGPPGSRSVQRQLERATRGVTGVTIRLESLSRSDCLAALRSAAAVILPSKVEASPVAALEAAASNPNVIASRITGHVELLSEYGPLPDNCLFDPTSPDQLASALATAEINADAGTGSLVASHERLIRQEVREAARVRWGDRIAHWLQVLGQRSNGTALALPEEDPWEGSKP